MPTDCSISGLDFKVGKYLNSSIKHLDPKEIQVYPLEPMENIFLNPVHFKINSLKVNDDNISDDINSLNNYYAKAKSQIESLNRDSKMTNHPLIHFNGMLFL